MRRTRRTRGFTLIEALVAVVLLALLFGALMPVFQQGLSVLRSGDRFTRAALLAQSVLEYTTAIAAASGAGLAAGTRRSSSPGPSNGLPGQAAGQAAEQGEFEDFRWQLERAAYVPVPIDGQDSAAQDSVASDPEAWQLVRVSVRVTWPDNDSGVQLHTLLLQAPQ